MEHDHLLDLRTIMQRENYPDPSIDAQQSQIYRQEIVYRDMIYEPIIKDTNTITSTLETLYRDFFLETHQAPNSAQLSSEFVQSHITNSLRSAALDSAEMGNLNLFMLLFDSYVGATLISGAIAVAESAEKELDAPIRNAFNTVGELQRISLPDQAEIYLDQLPTLKMQVELYMEDRTGKTLLTEIVKNIKGLPNKMSTRPLSDSLLLSPMVTAGAEQAKKCYFDVFPETATLLKNFSH